MHEHIFSGRTLDEPVAFGPVKPLYSTLLSHKLLLSPLLEYLLGVTAKHCGMRSTLKLPDKRKSLPKLSQFSKADFIQICKSTLTSTANAPHKMYRVAL
jgi:hypothetical protein